MLNIGTGEIFVLLLVALLIFGPNKLPEMMRNMGRAMRMFQQETRKATELLREGLEEPRSSAGVIDKPDIPPVQAQAQAPASPPVVRDAAVLVEHDEPAIEITDEMRRFEDT